LSSRGPRSSRRVSSSATRRLPALAQRFEIYYYRIHVPAAGTRGPMILRRLRYHLLYSCTRTMQSQIDAAVGRPPLSGAARCKPVSRAARRAPAPPLRISLRAACRLFDFAPDTLRVSRGVRSHAGDVWQRTARIWGWAIGPPPPSHPSRTSRTSAVLCHWVPGTSPVSRCTAHTSSSSGLQRAASLPPPPPPARPAAACCRRGRSASSVAWGPTEAESRQTDRAVAAAGSSQLAVAAAADRRSSDSMQYVARCESCTDL
jgi:hypothetical protein